MEINITINERITDLRTMSGLSQKELADRIDVPTSTLCRIEQGKIANVSNDILIKLANFFNVSTDYLLGLTNVKFKKNVELSELGLSNKALFALLSGSVNAALLSRMIEHPHFVTLLDTADAYFKDAHKTGIQSRNDVINLATASLKDFMKEHPENRMEISHDIRQLNAEKIGGDEADLNKLRNIFMSILKDIKADYGNVPQDIEFGIGILPYIDMSKADNLIQRVSKYHEIAEFPKIRFEDNTELRDMQYRIILDDVIMADNDLEYVEEKIRIDEMLSYIKLYIN